MESLSREWGNRLGELEEAVYGDAMTAIRGIDAPEEVRQDYGKAAVGLLADAQDALGSAADEGGRVRALADAWARLEALTHEVAAYGRGA